MRKIHLIGNAHLDPVWLWQWQEGFAEIKATFKSALDRMKEFDNFKFTSACASYYMWIEKSDKAMFEEIRQRVKEGRWCIVGGWFLQPDCNLPCGEAFARHALISQRYFKEKFGITAKTGYNVDSFGHNASIPKMLKNSRMDNYVFMRPMPHEKELPASLFSWESMDGSAVTTYRIPLFYNIELSRFEAFDEVKKMEPQYDLMAFYGVGNHGGGPTIELLNRMNAELGDEFFQSTPDEYFGAVNGLTLPTVTGDLQFHAKGCYSAHSGIKEGNRRSENALINAEMYSVLSNAIISTPYPSDELQRGWKDVLFNQFHDILGGCSIKEAYTDAAFLHGEAQAIAQRCENFALQQISWNIDTMEGKELKPFKTCGPVRAEWVCTEQIGTPVVVFNPTDHEVSAAVTVRSLPVRMTDKNGNETFIQRVRDSKTNGKDNYATMFMAKLPPLGYTVYRMFYEGDECFGENTEFGFSENSIENSCLRLTFNAESGELSGIYDKAGGKELLSGSTSTVLIDETDCDTWAHGVSEFCKIAGVFEKGEIKLIENGSVRVVMRSVMRRGETEIIRDYALYRGSDEVRIKTKIDFHEKHKMLKFVFPANLENAKAFSKIPFGFIERPTDKSEQPCGEWIALKGSNGGIGIANSAQYSFSAEGSALKLTVLRGAIYADHYGERDEFCEYMDQGEHFFEYSIFPLKSLANAERRAQELNRKPTAIIETFHKGSLKTEFSALSVSEENISVTAVKMSEDSPETIVRAYECEDRSTNAVITVLGKEIKTHFSHSEVKTFLVSENAVREVDFIEWEK